ncbi:salivary glue protein Sgs-3-like [Sycon ciliatum]|uniref:salivary glue protein Sgs-3-like n=1 Tax=Sycon ciliatum TaxID=27933 RepID=UPI0031F71CD1
MAKKKTKANALTVIEATTSNGSGSSTTKYIIGFVVLCVIIGVLGWYFIAGRNTTTPESGNKSGPLAGEGDPNDNTTVAPDGTYIPQESTSAPDETDDTTIPPDTETEPPVDTTQPPRDTFPPIEDTTQAPTTEAPTTQAPTTQAPTTEAPTTQAPTTQAPTTQAPTTQAPTTQAPTTQAPTTQAPTTQAPTTQAPTYTPEEEQACAEKGLGLCGIPCAQQMEGHPQGEAQNIYYQCMKVCVQDKMDDVCYTILLDNVPAHLR